MILVDMNIIINFRYLFVLILENRCLFIMVNITIPKPYTNDIGPNNAPLFLFIFLILYTSDSKVNPTRLYNKIKFK